MKIAKINICLFCLLTLMLSKSDAQSNSPNIVLIISDDQGYADLGCYGDPDILTPHLDRLAKEGVRLTNFYVTGSGCTPSRSGLLTGRYPQRNGTYELFRNDRVNDGHQYTEYEYSISPERILGTDLREVFVSEVLNKAGYHNGYFGKWDLGQLHRFLPLQQGFDDFYGFANTGIDYFTHERYGIPSMLDGNQPTTKDKGSYTTDLFEREALEFLKKPSEQPFFLYLSYNSPHNPSNLDPDIRPYPQATEEYMKMYPEGHTKKEKQRQGYMAAVTQMDQSIGNILAEIKKRGDEENTLVIFLSDNGGSAGASNAPLRGGKAQFFEGGIRVPCIIKWPGKIPSGTVNDQFLSSLEIFPMVVSAAGASLPDNVVYDGFDMLPVLQGKSADPREAMFWEFRGDQAARYNNWKWVVDSKQGGGLFDLSKDIGEEKDLSAGHPDILQMMEAKFQSWKKEMDDAEPRGPFRDY